jgi:Ca2+-binding EF-hand superfamily protein
MVDWSLLDPVGVGINSFYWLICLVWGGWYLVLWKTDVPTEKWGRLSGLEDDDIKLLDQQEQSGRNKQKEADRNAMSPAAGKRSEDGQLLKGFYSSKEEFFFRSCGLFRLDNPFRRNILVLVHQPLFDNFILLLIVTNAGLMATEDPLEDPANPSDHTLFMQQIDFLFLLAFTGEMLLKIIAYGFILGPNTYLRSSWNILDGVIVGTAWVPYFIPVNASSSGMRAFRLLRPLRTISRFPGLKRLVTAILLAIPQLGNLLLLCGLFFLTLGIVGVQLWHGRWLQRCHNEVLHPSCGEAAEAEGEDCQLFTQYANDASPHCDIDLPNTWSDSCGVSDAVCEEHLENPFSDIMSFDSLAESFPIVLQLLTLAAWQDLMHISWETSGLYTTAYYVLSVLLGAYFMMNLFVAIIKDKFDVASAVGDEGKHAFEGIDESGDGLLDIEEVGAIFLKNGVYLSEEELAFVFSKIDADGGGDVDVDEFMDWLRGSTALAAKLRNKMSVDGEENSSDEEDALDTSDPIGSAKKKLTKLALVHGVVDWSILFNYYDRRGSGELEFLEFKAALRRDAYISPQMMPDGKIKELFDAVDDDGGGTVSIAEFEAWITGKTDLPEDHDHLAAEEEERLAVRAVYTVHALSFDPSSGPTDLSCVCVCCRNFSTSKTAPRRM